MAAKDRAAKARQTAEGAWSSPQVQRLMQDPELRENLRTAFISARSAYARLNSGKAKSKQIFDDKKLHKELQNTADALRDASQALREGPKKRRRRGGLAKLLLVAIVGAGLALALSESLRNKVLDALFGAEEEFDYASTTSPAPAPPPAPEPAPAATTDGEAGSS
jgi:hypothetical protein